MRGRGKKKEAGLDHKRGGNGKKVHKNDDDKKKGGNGEPIIRGISVRVGLRAGIANWSAISIHHVDYLRRR